MIEEKESRVSDAESKPEIVGEEKNLAADASKTTSKIEKALKVSEPSSKMISRFETPSLKEERKNELLSA